jgi:hypothetical protein
MLHASKQAMDSELVESSSKGWKGRAVPPYKRVSGDLSKRSTAHDLMENYECANLDIHYELSKIGCMKDTVD